MNRLQNPINIAALTVTVLGASLTQGALVDAKINPARYLSTWTDVRVEVARDGSVRSETVAYDSGNAHFNASALAAVAATKFVRAARGTRSSTFDYLLATRADGTRTSHVLARLGDTENPSSQVRIPSSGDAWLAIAPSCGVLVQ